VLTDGEMRFDIDVGGRSWAGYILDRLGGLAPYVPPEDGRAEIPSDVRPPSTGTILGEVIRQRSEVVGPLDARPLQYGTAWKTAQRLTAKPVKMGSCSAQRLDPQLANRVHRDRDASLIAIAQAVNAEYHRLADAGCPAIQIEEPSLHNVTDRDQELTLQRYVDAFNVEVAGLRAKTEVWCHTCWGNPFAQRLASTPTLKTMLPYADALDVDVITFETAENDGAELAEIGAAVGKDKKVAIGVVRHRSLQVETPAEVAALIRKALRYIEPERLILSSDCGFGRQGMSRVHALYKMVAIVAGTNIVRRELGLPEAAVSAMEVRFSL